MPVTDLLESTEPERIASGFQFTEGPVWHPDGALFFSDIPANRIYRWWPDGRPEVYREPSNNSNGLTLDRDGHLIVCEHSGRRVSRTEADGSVVAIAERYQGKRLNSPNDTVVHSDGSIYFTDPPYGISSPDEREIPFNGIYRLSPQGELTLLADDFDRPNGLAFSPDQSVLYVDDTSRLHVRAFDVQPDGTIANGRIFAEVDENVGKGRPDGLKVDVEGNVFVTGPGGMWLFRADGTHIGALTMPEVTANCAWGDEDRRTLYMTASTSVYRIRSKVQGIAPL